MSIPQGSYTNINWNGGNQFFGYILNNEIYDMNNTKIGVSLDFYTKVEEALTKCKNRLIELGEIKVPKTQEEIIQEQSEMIAKQQQMLQEIIKKVGVKDGFNTTYNELDTERETRTSKTNDNKSTKKNKPNDD
ncbi:TPA: hypothetical protein CPT96_03255 [Candidatus Gastranaerophilales bacterium HUM_10]|mgnify:CR=1 FL=1|nr:MAG TPA: hypothetical protein CPT96_03255 [Candidatus Gastranaerophilales bacterium HUM_10]